METREYEVMFECEEDHWWYRGLRSLVLPEVISRLGAGGRALDAGCGTGANLAALAEAGVEVVGLERAEAAFPFLKRRGAAAAARGTIDRMPFPDGAFDVVLSTDVLCCLEPTAERAAFREVARVLRPGGAAVLNLPAFEAVRSEHDEAVHTRTRYTLAGLTARLAEAGLRVRRGTYRNTILFPAAFLARRLRRAFRRPGRSPASDLRLPPRPLGRLLELPLKIENLWIGAGGRLPFGLSVHCVATKD